MNDVQTSEQAVGSRTVATNKGTTRSDVSSQWWRRPDDQRFTSLTDLRDTVYNRSQRSIDTAVDLHDDLNIVVDSANPDALKFRLECDKSGPITVTPNHWSFGQLCGLVKAPANYLRDLPGAIAAVPLAYGVKTRLTRGKPLKAFSTLSAGQDGPVRELRALTGLGYGRIHDYEAVDAVVALAGDGHGETRWKIPGVLDWSTRTYDPHAVVTKRSTTLFASDRDIFLFLVDDTHPIEIGKLPNGDPDYLFRGFFVSNSEVGNASFRVATFYLRAVCQNRILWGVEDFNEIRLVHSKNAPRRFAEEVGPALASFANGSDTKLIEGVAQAKKPLGFDTDAERIGYLRKRKFAESEIAAVLSAVVDEEGHPANSRWDFAQGITAIARNVGHQDTRVGFEKRAGAILN